MNTTDIEIEVAESLLKGIKETSILSNDEFRSALEEGLDEGHQEEMNKWYWKLLFYFFPKIKEEAEKEWLQYRASILRELG